MKNRIEGCRSPLFSGYGLESFFFDVDGGEDTSAIGAAELSPVRERLPYSLPGLGFFLLGWRVAQA